MESQNRDEQSERKSIELISPAILNCAVGESNEPVLVNEKDPPEARLAAFNHLWQENERLLKMPKDVNFPINYRRGWDWASHHCDSASIKFAEAIVANTAYISFGEFMTSIGKICNSFKRFYQKSNGNTIFVLVVPFDMTKSNIWVSLLMWPELRDLINDIDFDITSVYNRYIAREKTKKRVVCIICDDCAYTGNQLLGYCTLSVHRTEYPGRPAEPINTDPAWIEWNQIVTARVAEIESALTVDSFSINLLIPYMSTHAQQNIMDRRFLMIPKDVQIFKLFRERVNMHDFPQGTLREFESTFQYHSNIAAIYFDHKIADAISTFNKVYLLAPVFGCGNLRKSVCFIDGCSSKREIPRDMNIYDIYINVEDVLVRGNACPPTFYKSIKYTMNGKSINNLCLYNALAEHKERRRDRAGKKK
jgi:hypothetical protein